MLWPPHPNGLFLNQFKESRVRFVKDMNGDGFRHGSHHWRDTLLDEGGLAEQPVFQADFGNLILGRNDQIGRNLIERSRSDEGVIGRPFVDLLPGKDPVEQSHEFPPPPSAESGLPVGPCRQSPRQNRSQQA